MTKGRPPSRAALLALAAVGPGALGLAALGSCDPAAAICAPPGAAASVEEVVARVESEGVKYIFVGERHGIGPAKRFAVDLSNALSDLGHDVGLYVEGFRTDCAPKDAACANLAGLFNREAFQRLLEEARVPVHPLDPPEKDRRAARMAATIAAGREAIRVVLVGRSHVLHAADPDAELWVYGGGMRYPDPGDLVEAFPRGESLTFSLEAAGDGVEGYALRRTEGCGADYSVVAPYVASY